MSFSCRTNIYADMMKIVLDSIRYLYPNIPELIMSKIVVTCPKYFIDCDMTTNAPLVIAKAVGDSPKTIAAILADYLVNSVAESLAASDQIKRAEPAGKGFVNIWMHPAALRVQITAILLAGSSYGDSEIGGEQAVNVEYVSANPTGPMHIGHCRGAVVGDALANLLTKAGYCVTKEYYINDAGAQVQALAWATYWRYLQIIGTTLTEAQFGLQAPGGLQYQGEYLIPVAG